MFSNWTIASRVLPGSQRGQVAAVEELQELDDELHVADAAVAGLHVAVVGAVARVCCSMRRFSADAGDVGAAQVAAVDPRPELFEELPAQVQVAGGGPGLDIGLPLPGPAADVVIAQRRRRADDHRPALPLGPQPQVHAVGRAELRGLGQQPHQLAGEPIEELGVGHRPPAVGRAVEVVEEDQVDVAGVVQLDAAELAHAQDHEAGRAAVGTAGSAPLARSLFHAARNAAFQDRVGQVGNLRGHGLQALLADDVAVGDPQHLAPLEPPQGPQHRLVVLQRRHLAGDVLDELCRA